MKKLLTFLCFTLFYLATNAQIAGVITDENGDALIGVSVLEKGTSNGTISDVDGSFRLSPKTDYPVTLVFSYVGYGSHEITYNGATNNVSLVMAEGVGLDEIVVTGTRGKPRTILDSPVPIDNIAVDDLRESGKPIIERMLTYKVPSFNSQNQAISDATAHYDPADLRGLGPSRTLVLVNGKRKNQSAQVYLNRTPGKGEVGIDLKSIPTAAIDHIEVLRDGASAQYGSDAIAGVINMVLKKNATWSNLSAFTGITQEGDGFHFGADFNKTFNFGEGGYANLTLGYYKQNLTNRAGEPGIADLPSDARPNEQKWAEDNPDLGMHVGQPDLDKRDIFVNIGHPIGSHAEIYTFHGYTTRTGRSFAYYRAPYWRRDVADAGFITRPEDFLGYQPTFETDIDDHINALGLNFDIFGGINGDVSLTYGSNKVDYTVNNSVNRDYLADFGTSPRSFNPGGYSLSNLIGNLDLSKELTSAINLAFGVEYKKEYFKAFEGNPLSYYKGGSDSFAGIKPDEAGDWDRNSIAGYAQLDYDITDDLLVGVAGRYEDFSDFGDNFSYKANARYKIGNNGAVRASYSTGFRAPTLHQRYLTNSQYIIVAGSSEPLLQGTLANDNSAVKALGVPSLFAETSQNISAGLTYRITDELSASLDFYQINVDDRVLFSSQIGTLDGDLDGSDAVEQILIDNNVVAVQFFINAGDTKTTGGDIVLNYNGNSGFNAILAANLNQTEIDAISTPDALKEGGYNIFDRQEQGLIINSRPKSKVLLGLGYDHGNWTFGLNNTMFGKVTVTAPSGGLDADGNELTKLYTDENGNDVRSEDQDLAPQIVTDLSIGYNIADGLGITFAVNNLLDAYPDETAVSTNTAQAGARFVYSSEVQQQGQLGRNFRLGLNYRFK